jgi:hypothetical protein
LFLGQSYPWSFFAKEDGIDLGFKPKPPLANNMAQLGSVINSTSKQGITARHIICPKLMAFQGFLGAIPDMYYVFSNGSFAVMPFYVEVDGGEKGLDDMIGQTVRG